MKTLNVVRTAAVVVAAGLASVAAQAQSLVFDSLTGGQGVYTQCFVCSGGSPTIAELGDVITFGGSNRFVTSVEVLFNQSFLSGGAAYQADLTLALYNAAGTNILGVSELSRSIGSSGAFTVSFSFGAGVQVPDTIYYGLSVSSANANINDLRVALWDYYGAAFGGDGNLLPCNANGCSDPGTAVLAPDNVTSVVYGRLATSPSVLTPSTGGGLGPNPLNDGFTPAVRFTAAAAVPEPTTYGMMALGLLGVAAVARRRKAA